MKPCNEFTLSEWLSFLENRHLTEIQLGLDRVSQVAQKLGLLQLDALVITVAGTNGKGSTVAALESIYRAAGYQVGAYTSPHLVKFNERIRVNQQWIDDEALCQAFSIIEKGRGAIALTYFEMATLAALWYFKNTALDLIILEVGLGGRLDATNIIDSDLAIITTIDLDHQDFLGDTREAIGYEKAGILRQGKPMIFADINPVNSILDQIKERESPAYLLNRDYFHRQADGQFHFEWNEQCHSFPLPRLHANAVAAAIMASLILQSRLPVSMQAIKQGIADASLAGRLQLINGPYSILMDVSHNPQSVRHLAARIQQLNPKGKVHAIFSALADKDIRGMVEPMANCVEKWYIAPIESKRAASKDALLTIFNDFDKIPLYFDRLTDAYYSACNQAVTGDLIVIYGSFLTVGALMGIVPLS